MDMQLFAYQQAQLAAGDLRRSLEERLDALERRVAILEQAHPLPPPTDTP